MATSVPRFWSARDGFPPSKSKLLATFCLLVAVGCSEQPLAQTTLQASTVTTQQSTAAIADGISADGGAAVSDDSGASQPPDWLGTRVLPTVPGGAVVAPQTTPEELRDRRLVTMDRLDPPGGDRFESTLGPVPAEVLNRSTWVEGCPVAPEELNYLTMSFWGFDGRHHTGEMIVHTDVGADVLSVFARLHEARFPIEQMSVVDLTALEAEPTGDGNNTTSFVCRPVTGGRSFSQHAYGLAIDVNPFHNPYRKQDLVLPELAVDYLERDRIRDGMLFSDDLVVRAFADIGWSWGGNWNSLKDYQHFALNNR
jgi:hypothetical protein